MKKPFVCIITGPSGAGKSTLSKSLATQIKRSAYIDVDTLRFDLIKNGLVGPVSYKGESKKQSRLAIKNASDLAINFLKEGFNVFIDDVLERGQEVKDYITYLKKYHPRIILLLPNKKVLKKRDSNRDPEDIMGERSLELHDIFSKIKSTQSWFVLDTSNHSKKDSEKEILKILNQK